LYQKSKIVGADPCVCPKKTIDVVGANNYLPVVVSKIKIVGAVPCVCPKKGGFEMMRLNQMNGGRKSERY
jgi:hypothetical protein